MARISGTLVIGASETRFRRPRPLDSVSFALPSVCGRRIGAGSPGCSAQVGGEPGQEGGSRHDEAHVRCQACQERASQWSRPRSSCGALEAFLDRPAQSRDAGEFGSVVPAGAKAEIARRGAAGSRRLRRMRSEALEPLGAGPGQRDPGPIVEAHALGAFNLPSMSRPHASGGRSSAIVAGSVWTSAQPSRKLADGGWTRTAST